MTTYSHLSDEEFLVHVDDRLHKSPILAEFARRLNTKVDNAPSVNTNHRAECPVCMAALHVEFDPGNDLFDVKFDKDSTQ